MDRRPRLKSWEHSTNLCSPCKPSAVLQDDYKVTSQPAGKNVTCQEKSNPLTIREGSAQKASLPAILGKTRCTLRQDKSRRGERECDLKPLVAIQRVRLPPG